MRQEGQRTMRDVLMVDRRAHIVGRTAERELFRSALTHDEPRFCLLYVSGPGGIGKSTLLELYAEDAAAADAQVAWIDGRDQSLSPADLLRAVAPGRRGTRPGAAPIAVPGTARLVVLIDGYENLEPLEGWVRDSLLPQLPDTSLIVVAGRHPPAAEWLADPAWSGRIRFISLRNLSSADALNYLRGRAVPEEKRAAIAELTHGHPLALSLLTDVIGRDPEVDLSTFPPDLMRGLLARLVSRSPSSDHQRALGVMAVARRTSEDVLRSVLTDPAIAHTAFEWLEGLSFVDPVPDGLVPHDLVRDLLDADLRWRDPPTYREVFRALHDDAMRRISSTTGRSQQAAIADLKFLFRNLRSVLAPVAWEAWGGHYPDQAASEDRPAILTLVGAAEGRESAQIAAHWLDRQLEGFHVIRGANAQVRGVVGLLDLTAATDEERRTDPGADAAWRFAQSAGPVRPGERVLQCRFVVDGSAYQDPSPTLNAVPILTLQRQLATPALAWDFVTLAEPDRWNDFFEAADSPRAVGADFVVAGRTYGLFGHDFRRVPISVMTRRWTERALADDALLVPPQQEPETLVLAHADFADAVREALRDLHRPDLLARSPLLRTRLVDRADAATACERLGELVRTAVAALGDDPRDDPLLRAVTATYVEATRTQEAAAQRLDVPFSSYRRHLAKGTDRVVEWLWRRDIGTATQER
jgi:hypothetical protein